MNWFRILLGMVTLALLIPAAALYTHSGMSPWGEAQASPPSSEGGDQTKGSGRAHGRGETEANGRKGSPPDHSGGKGHEHPADALSSTTSSSTTTQAPGNTMTISTTTTSASTTSTATTSSDPGLADDVITGDACPCTVTSTVELQGVIHLRGDLMVHGGTLIARPGVDLNGNGFQIMFMDGGRADFQGTPVFAWSGDGSNANLNRDIKFRNLRRIMFHQGAAPSTLRFFSVSDSGTSLLGDYPLHWHLNGDSTRGTVVEGVVVVNGKHHAFVPHGSHGITFKDTIAKNILDTAYWWDPAGSNNCSTRRQLCTTDNSNNIIYDHALAYGVSLPHGSPGFHRVSGFQLGAGSSNVIRNSAAMQITGGADCAGFHWPESANHNVGGNVWAFTSNISRSSSACHGIFVWQNDPNGHVIEGFSGDGVDHGAYVNAYSYRNINTPYLQVHALGWSVSNSTVGDVTVHRHVLEVDTPTTFTNVTMNSLTIDNRSSTEFPGTYILNSTNIDCRDVVVKSIVPGSKVIIDGVQCQLGA